MLTFLTLVFVLFLDAGAENFWPGIMYLVAGALYFIAASLGYFMSHFAILNTRDKRTKNCAATLFLIIMLFTLVVVGKLLWKDSPHLLDFCCLTLVLSLLRTATIFVQSILLSSNIVDVDIDDQLRGELACSIAQSSCSFCYNEDGKRECPEWDDSDVKAGKIKGH